MITSWTILRSVDPRANIKISGLANAILGGSCQTLRKLIVCLPQPGFSDATDTLSDILNKLRCLGNKANRLRAIEITHKNHHELLFESSFLPLYHELDTLLASAFPSLRKFRMQTMSLVDKRQERDMCLKPFFQQRFRSVMESCFPKFVAMDGSNIKFSPETGTLQHYLW